MRTGKLSISRGHELPVETGRPGPRLTLVARPEPPSPAMTTPDVAIVTPSPASPDYQLMHDRLTTLERLARLRAEGVLSEEELAAEKAIVLSLPADELVLHEAVQESPVDTPLHPRGPSLLGRMFSWKFLPVGLVAGIGLSFGTQPQETMRFFDEALRLFGA